MMQPRSLVLMAAMCISGGEFLLGMMTLVGAYRRSAPLLLLVMMAVMLPLTAWIMMANPVKDCGCFGDFWVMSNTMTFVKNLIITLALILLLMLNRNVRGLYGPYIQWLPAFLTVLYAIVVGQWGYNVQPLIDFRSFPVGSSLRPSADSSEQEEEEDMAVKFRWIYERNGERRAFSDEELGEVDDSWTFVERELESGDAGTDNSTQFIVREDGLDVTEEIIPAEGREVIVVVPEGQRLDVSYTYALNEIQQYVDARGGTMIGLLGTQEDLLDHWRELMMADYPLYAADQTMLKELARGAMALVYLEDGKIQWKRNMFLIDAEWFSDPKRADVLAELKYDGPALFWWLTAFYLGLMGLLAILDGTGQLLKWRKQAKKAAQKRNN